MIGSLERVRRVLANQKPDHAPLFDLLPNDAVLAYFNDGRPVACGDDVTGLRAIARAVDATRYSFFSPTAEKTETLPDGRERRVERWTFWTPPRVFASSREYAEHKTRVLDEWEPHVCAPMDLSTCKDCRADAGGALPHVLYAPMELSAGKDYQATLIQRNVVGEDFYYLLDVIGPSLMMIYGEVGLESFSYYLADCEDVIIRQLELTTEYMCNFVRSLPEDDPFEMVFTGDDIAFNTGPLVSPVWLRKHYFPRLKRVIDAVHKRNKKVMFHSDGNLNAIMDDLVDCGIDVLNPIEVAAGMDIKDLHKRYPSLFFAGGIDVSQLLPFGTVQEVKDAVTRAIDDSDGRILVGSSTEVHNAVPLENFLAMREAAMSYSFR